MDNKRFMHADIRDSSRQMTVLLSKTVICVSFGHYIFQTDTSPKLLNCNMNSLVCFSLTLKWMTLDDREWPFCVKVDRADMSCACMFWLSESELTV